MRPIYFVLLLTISASVLASDCPSWLRAQSNYASTAACHLLSSSGSMDLEQALLYGEAPESSKRHQEGVSLAWVELNPKTRDLRVIDRVSGLGEDVLPVQHQEKNFRFLEWKTSRETLYIVRTKSDRVSLTLVFKLEGSKLKALEVKERNGLIRDALVGTLAGVPKVLKSSTYPLYVRLPVEEEKHRTYFLMGSQLVSR